MFSGAFTAIVTPFTDSGEVDFDALRDLVHVQIDNGINGIVPCGTTGESPTLTVEEHEQVIRAVIEEADGEVPVIAGTGSNNTAEAVHLTKKAAEFGADGALVIMPYYNKPMPEGQFEHFKTVAEAGDIPVVVYNVPSRTGKRIEAEDVARMYESIEQVVALKDAVGDIEYSSAVLSLCDIDLLSGDDSMTFPMMALGGRGVISVASNIVPGKISEMVREALDSNFEKARTLHFELWSLFKNMFIETNPIPVKTAMEMMGLAKANFRLPMSAIEDENRARLEKVLISLDLIE